MRRRLCSGAPHMAHSEWWNETCVMELVHLKCCTYLSTAATQSMPPWCSQCCFLGRVLLLLSRLNEYQLRAINLNSSISLRAPLSPAPPQPPPALQSHGRVDGYMVEYVFWGLTKFRQKCDLRARERNVLICTEIDSWLLFQFVARVYKWLWCSDVGSSAQGVRRRLYLRRNTLLLFTSTCFIQIRNIIIINILFAKTQKDRWPTFICRPELLQRQGGA